MQDLSMTNGDPGPGLAAAGKLPGERLPQGDGAREDRSEGSEADHRQQQRDIEREREVERLREQGGGRNSPPGPGAA